MKVDQTHYDKHDHKRYFVAFATCNEAKSRVRPDEPMTHDGTRVCLGRLIDGWPTVAQCDSNVEVPSWAHRFPTAEDAVARWQSWNESVWYYSFKDDSLEVLEVEESHEVTVRKVRRFKT